MNKYEFRVVKNKLSNPLPVVYVENEYFYIKICRCDILFEDLDCSTQYIVKTKQSDILLDFDPNTQLIKYNLIPFLFIDKIDDFIWQLEVIKQSWMELKKIADKMFKEYEEKSTDKRYENGIDEEYNESEAYECYKKAAECGNAEAMYRIGVYYENGIGVAKNVLKAYEWYKKAADGGHDVAKKIIKNLR